MRRRQTRCRKGSPPLFSGEGGVEEEPRRKPAASGLGELVRVEEAEDTAEAAEAAEVFLPALSRSVSSWPLRRRRLLRTELDLERMRSPRSNMAESERPKVDFPFSISATIRNAAAGPVSGLYRWRTGSGSCGFELFALTCRLRRECSLFEQQFEKMAADHCDPLCPM